ncbi:hypothetical protein [Rhodococcus sp. AG1013]|uniref:hypothetical protein n=1 Tax=Rhodococcus sp. AG1013 TaxID=2183996 RepID=UPI0011C080D0|nr:hypothetical protein [Rhodococcus sp. AG1013]
MNSHHPAGRRRKDRTPARPNGVPQARGRIVDVRGVNRVPTAALRALLLVLTGLTLTVACSAIPTGSGVTDGGEPPVGIATGPTLYYLDGTALRPVTAPQGTVWDEPWGKLGDLRRAIQMLGLGAGRDLRDDTRELRNEVPRMGASLADIDVTVTETVITVSVPVYDLSPPAVDQVVCTALAVDAARGNPGQGKSVDILLHNGLSGDKVAGRKCPVL